MFSDFTDRDPVGEDSDRIQFHAPTGLQRTCHGITVRRFNANNLHIRAQGLEKHRHAADQPAAAHRNEHGIDAPGTLPQDFIGHGPLTGDDKFVIKGMNERHA